MPIEVVAEFFMGTLASSRFTAGLVKSLKLDAGSHCPRIDFRWPKAAWSDSRYSARVAFLLDDTFLTSSSAADEEEEEEEEDENDCS